MESLPLASSCTFILHILGVWLHLLAMLWNTFYMVSSSIRARNTVGGITVSTNISTNNQWTRANSSDDRHGWRWVKCAHFSWKWYLFGSDEIKAVASGSSIVSLTAILGSHQPTNVTFFKRLKAPTRIKDKGNSRETSVCLTDRKPGCRLQSVDCKVVLDLRSATPSQFPWSALHQQNSSLRS